MYNLIIHSGPENLKKSRQKNSWNQINKKNFFFSWNCISGSFKLFPSSKIEFWPFLKLQKMEVGQKKFSAKLIYLIWRVFLAWTFLNFLTYCAIPICTTRITILHITLFFSFLPHCDYGWNIVGSFGTQRRRTSIIWLKLFQE